MFSVEFTIDGPFMWGYMRRKSRLHTVCIIDIAWLQIKIVRRTK